jgi:hypothetical protein
MLPSGNKRKKNTSQKGLPNITSLASGFAKDRRDDLIIY